MADYASTKNFTSFKGVNNVLRPEDTPNDYLKKAVNINFNKKGHLSKRKGYTLEDAGIFTSLWSNSSGTRCYCVKNGDLYKITKEIGLIPILAGVGDLPLSFEEVSEEVYFVSPVVTGIIMLDDTIRDWGVPLPTTSPTLSESSGSLRSGSYQVSITYVDSFGYESGSILASQINVSASSGIIVDLSTLNTNNISKINVYCTTPDGTVQYFIGSTSVFTTFEIGSVESKGNPLRSFNKRPAPKGTIVKLFKGRLFIANGDTLWFSEPYQYSSFRMLEDYILLPSSIYEVMPVEDGIWIGSDNIYFLSGNSPGSFNMILKERVRVVEGTSHYFSGSYIQLDNTPVGYKWLVTTDLGIFVLFNKGLIINLTAGNIILDKGDTGTSLFLQDEGFNQYLSIIKNNGEDNNSVMGDIVTTSIIRNGINIG